MTGEREQRVELDHLVLEVKDPVRSIRFYTDVLGLEPVRLREFLEGEAPFPSVRISRGTVLDMFPPRMWRGRRLTNQNHFCLAYSSSGLKALRMRLRRRKVAIVRQDNHNYGARGYGRADLLPGPRRPAHRGAFLSSETRVTRALQCLTPCLTATREICSSAG